MPEPIRVASLNELPPGTAKELTVQGRVVALFNVEGNVYALDGICPHAGGPLGEGTLDGPVVTCPWHGWQFDVTSGRHCLTEKIRQTTFPVTVRGDEIYVELPEAGS